MIYRLINILHHLKIKLNCMDVYLPVQGIWPHKAYKQCIFLHQMDTSSKHVHLEILNLNIISSHYFIAISLNNFDTFNKNKLIRIRLVFNVNSSFVIQKLPRTKRTLFKWIIDCSRFFKHVSKNNAHSCTKVI